MYVEAIFSKRGKMRRAQIDHGCQLLLIGGKTGVSNRYFLSSRRFGADHIVGRREPLGSIPRPAISGFY